jgi:ribosome-associated toxin RatA of RatAB toxin-antitoxin module
MSAESGTESIEIRAFPERILQVVSDIDSYPTWMDEYKEATVLERDEQARPTHAHFEMDTKVKTVRYVLKYSYPGSGVAGESEEGGDVKLIKGSYLLSPSGDVTTVTYQFEMDPGFPVPSFILRRRLKMIVGRTLDELKSRVESGA